MPANLVSCLAPPEKDDPFTIFGDQYFLAQLVARFLLLCDLMVITLLQHFQFGSCLTDTQGTKIKIKDLNRDQKDSKFT